MAILQIDREKSVIGLIPSGDRVPDGFTLSPVARRGWRSALQNRNILLIQGEQVNFAEWDDQGEFVVGVEIGKVITAGVRPVVKELRRDSTFDRTPH